MSSNTQVRAIVPAGPGWFVATPVKHDEFVEVSLDPVVAWACSAETLSPKDMEFYGTQSVPIVGGKEHWGDPVGIMRPDGKIISTFGDHFAVFRNTADFVAAWRETRAGQ